MASGTIGIGEFPETGLENMIPIRGRMLLVIMIIFMMNIEAVIKEKCNL